MTNYSLSLMSLDSPETLPSKGKDLVIIAKIKDFYHARIFDRSGKQVIDKGKDEFVPDEVLARQLDEAFSNDSIDIETQTKLIQKIVSSVGHTQMSVTEIFRRSVLLVYQAAPTEIRNLVAIEFILGVGPSATLFLGKTIVDEAVGVLDRGTAENAIATVLGNPILLWSIAISLFLSLTIDAFRNAVEMTTFSALRDRIHGFVKSLVLNKVSSFNDVALFETPNLLNLVKLTEKSILQLQKLSPVIGQSFEGIFILVASVSLSGAISWWIPLLIIASSVPSIYVEIQHRQRTWGREEKQANLTREMDIYAGVMMGETYAKEVRLLSLKSVLLDRWQGLWDQMFLAMQQVRREGLVNVTFWSLVSGLGMAVPYVHVILGVLGGEYTLGDLALYTGIILQLRRSLYRLISNVGTLYEIILAAEPIFQLQELQPQLTSGSHVQLPPLGEAPESQGIQIRNLSFTYPESHKPTLKEVNLNIRPGEMVALVGENGAGKTTLSKLLCRLYDPQEGGIYWNGENIRSFDINMLRSKIAVVMQDYARFPATLRENVGWGFLSDSQSEQNIHHALQEAGIGHLVSTLEKGLETPLGKQLQDGMDLSGGQWQRLAIARSLMRLDEGELLVFDEPTAALDPKHEQEIYDIFRKIARGRMTVVVSHRLALAKMADRIVVMEYGQILENGTHDELMALGQRYYEMFTRQVSSYE